MDDRCPRCGAEGNYECNTLSGKDHRARTRVMLGSPRFRFQRLPGSGRYLVFEQDTDIALGSVSRRRTYWEAVPEDGDYLPPATTRYYAATRLLDHKIGRPDGEVPKHP